VLAYLNKNGFDRQAHHILGKEAVAVTSYTVEIWRSSDSVLASFIYARGERFQIT
jgi:hypothetical protein